MNTQSGTDTSICGPGVRQRNGAFATLYAIWLISLLAVALTTVSAVLTRDVQRTSTALVDAQLRTLLRAGADFALARAAAGNPAPFEVTLLPLPLELIGDGFSLEAAAVTENAVQITARWKAGRRTQSRSQTITGVRVAPSSGEEKADIRAALSQP